MVERGRPGLVINTGSKQGITTPPGNPAYNVSKAGVKALTEALQHELRNMPGCKISAHLMIPGHVFTGLTARGRTEKPPGAWTPEQTVDFMIARIDAGDFYILCPDNDVPRPLDERRMLWAIGDIVENRPALSRWHPDYADGVREVREGVVSSPSHPNRHTPRRRGIQFAAALSFEIIIVSGMLDPRFRGDDDLYVRLRSRGAWRPSFASSFVPFPNRGRREDRVCAAPAVSRAIAHRKTRTRAYRLSGIFFARALDRN
jgi:hypothetical protein